MVATGRTEEGLAAAVAGTKRQIGFYASTPAYLPVLEHHGWGDLHTEAHAMTKSGRWAELGDLVGVGRGDLDDDVRAPGVALAQGGAGLLVLGVGVAGLGARAGFDRDLEAALDQIRDSVGD